MDVLDVVDFEPITVEAALARAPGRRGHDAANRLLERWTRHAVEAYLAAAAKLELSGPPLVPARAWVAKTDAAEYTAYGRYYEGHGIRELRLLRHRSVKDRAVDKGEFAVAAFVLAMGRKVLGGGRRGKQYVLSQAEPDVRRVRVVEVGCEDGSYEVRFDGTVEQALDAYREFAEPRIADAIARRDYQPGADCADCLLVAQCPGIARTPGLLGIPEGPWQRRTWSMTTARDYGDCRQLPLIKDLRLPSNKSVEYGEEARRGLAVHALLDERHRAPDRRPCQATDVPVPPNAWRAGGWEISGAEAELGVQLLGDHHFVCPLRGVSVDAHVLPEYTIAAFDPLANVVIIAKVDLAIRQEETGWILRETKTTRTAVGADVLALYPQLALDLLLLNAGALPGGSTRGRVELERLTPSGPVLVRLTPEDPGLLDHCREVVKDRVQAWREDTEFSPKNHELACSDCSVARWCPDSETATKKKKRSTT